MIEHELKNFLLWPEGGPKPFPNYAKDFWIRPFSDPPGHSEVFSDSFSACPRGVSPHSDFFDKLFIWSQDFIFYDKNASWVGENQIWAKTESTIFRHFFQWKPPYFQGVFWVMELTGDPKLVFFKNSYCPWHYHLDISYLGWENPSKRGVLAAQSACVQQQIDKNDQYSYNIYIFHWKYMNFV